MNLKLKGACAVAAVALFAAGNAGAQQLQPGTDVGVPITDVFVSVVERDDVNAIVRNLVIDTGVTALELSDNAAAWSTTVAQEQQIKAFLDSSTGTVSFNVGGALTDQTFATDLQAFMTSGNTQGPGEIQFSALGTGIIKHIAFIANANQGTWVDGVLTANGPTDFGFHGFSWGNSVDGAVQPSNEIVFGQSSQIQEWRLDLSDGTINNNVIGGPLGVLSSDLGTGDISFAVIPVPAAVWLFGSALGLLAWVRRRTAA